MKDWIVRAIKTFVQAFFGVLIPEVCLMLSGGFPESWGIAWAILSPVVAAALAAGISAAWNGIKEWKASPDNYMICDNTTDDTPEGGGAE